MTNGADAHDASDQYEVAIVGAGPVGLALGVELGQRGVRCLLVERRTEQHQIPRGQNLTQRSLENFYAWGCERELRAERILPPGFPIAGVTAYQTLEDEHWYMPEGREVVQDYYFQANERLPQYLTERVLARRLSELPSVEVWTGWRAVSLEADARGGVLGLARSDPGGSSGTAGSAAGSGDTATVRARYVVGCDGARSFVRETVGIGRRAATTARPALLSVFRSRGLAETVRRFPPATTYRVLNPALEGYWQFFGRVDAVEDTWFFHAPADLSVADAAADCRAQIQASAGSPVDVDFQYVGRWEMRIEVAETYRAGGSLFIAGDAAHSHPPYGAFGLNTGLEDVRNLGWKLAAALRGWGGEQLLDSYSEERQPVFAQTGEQVIAAGISRDREFLQRHRPGDGDFTAAWDRFGAGEHSPRQYEPHYAGSSVVAGDEPGAAPGVWGRHAFPARAGHHLSPWERPDGRNVFQALGPDFTLLSLGPGNGPGQGHGEAEAFAARADELGVPLTVVRDERPAARDFYGAPLVLVRPDAFVAWAGDGAEAAKAVLEQVTGRGRERPGS